MNRIEKIEMRFPNYSEFEIKENEFLFKILSQLGNAEKADNDIISCGESGLSPSICFKKSKINNPQISFISSEDLKDSWKFGDLRLGFNLPETEETKETRKEEKYKRLSDKVGNYIKLSLGNKKYDILTLEQLFKRFDGKLISLNHAGFNIGPDLLPEQDYFSFRKKMAERSNLYKYPTGEEWPFIIPSTDGEFNNDITNETIDRNPKLEIVYSKFHGKPLIQLDIDTNLSKDKVMELLPPPYGVSYDDLKDFIRTIFIFTDWLGVILRIDLRFRSTGKDFGYWMIKKGGRITS